MAEKNNEHIPTDKHRENVKSLALVGITQEQIAEIIGISKNTLRKYYITELDHSRAKASASVGGVLYSKAMDGDTTAMIFWMKTQAGWREKDRAETPQQPIINIINPHGNN